MSPPFDRHHHRRRRQKSLEGISCLLSGGKKENRIMFNRTLDSEQYKLVRSVCRLSSGEENKDISYSNSQSDVLWTLSSELSRGM